MDVNLNRAGERTKNELLASPKSNARVKCDKAGFEHVYYVNADGACGSSGVQRKKTYKPKSIGGTTP